jgi:predicted AAA+ superfamily ATPase
VIQRPALHQAVKRALRETPVVALVGPRQCGKTTLARAIARDRAADTFDLEDAVDLARIANPRTTLDGLRGLVVIDEFQRRPELFEVLRVLVDRPRNPARFLVLGSAAPELVRGLTETLAGRIRLIEMGGFDLREVGPARLASLWLRGGLPLSFLASSEARSLRWRDDYIQSFLERDIPQLGISIPTPTLRRFWTMIAHYHAQIWNAAELARSLGRSEPTARRYLDILCGAFVVRQLTPWFENIAKRQVKAPKVYVRDSGLLHALLSLRTHKQLEAHPKYGASWEGFALEQVLAIARPREAYFWATHAGAELDLMVVRDGERIGFEMKCADAPSLTKSMRIALDELRLRRIVVVYPGPRSYRLANDVEVCPLADLSSLDL